MDKKQNLLKITHADGLTEIVPFKSVIEMTRLIKTHFHDFNISRIGEAFARYGEGIPKITGFVGVYHG